MERQTDRDRETETETEAHREDRDRHYDKQTGRFYQQFDLDT